MATLFTDADTIPMASSSTMPWDIDFSQHLAGGESVSSPTATLEDLGSGASFPSGISAVSVQSSTVVRVVLTNMTKGSRYKLVTRCVVSATKTPAVVTVVEVVI